MGHTELYSGGACISNCRLALVEHCDCIIRNITTMGLLKNLKNIVWPSLHIITVAFGSKHPAFKNHSILVYMYGQISKTSNIPFWPLLFDRQFWPPCHVVSFQIIFLISNSWKISSLKPNSRSFFSLKLMFRITIFSPTVHFYPCTPPPIHGRLPVTFRKWNRNLHNSKS